MRRGKWGILALTLGLLLAVSVPAMAGSGNGAIRGSAADANAPALGEIDYLFNNSGYQFWFTAESDLGPYTAGHSYHNVYKYDVGDTSDWCGPVNIPNRLPYNAADTDGGTAYYKIWDKTTETWVCGSD
jgi:hypothetical protein